MTATCSGGHGRGFAAAPWRTPAIPRATRRRGAPAAWFSLMVLDARQLQVPYSIDHSHVGALFGCVSRENGGTRSPRCSGRVHLRILRARVCPTAARRHSRLDHHLRHGRRHLQQVALSLLNLDDSAVRTRFRCVFVANMNNVGEHELQGVSVDDL